MYLLGVDTGGTKTRCIVLDEALTLLGTGSGGPGNYHATGPTGARDNIDGAIREALSAAAVDEAATLAAGFGMGGLDTESDRETIESFLADLDYLDTISVENDVAAAHHASFVGEPGVTVVAGTGAMAYGTDAAGDVARSSGWDWLLGDEGSGFDTARRGLQAATRAHDGRADPSLLVDAAIEHFALDRFDELLPVVYEELDHPKAIAPFAEHVVAVAREGDDAAMRILDDAAEELALAAAAVAEQLALDSPVRVGCSGSFVAAEGVFERFETAVAARLLGSELLDPVSNPVVGTLSLLTDELDARLTREALAALDDEFERRSSDG